MSDENVVDPDDAGGVVSPRRSEIPSPSDVTTASDATGVVVWHRKHLRVEDHRALTEATATGDVVCPLFVFDPAFYTDGGLACDARLRFLHEAVTSLDRLYAAAPGDATTTAAPESPGRVGDELGVDLSPPSRGWVGAETPETLESEGVGMTVGYGDPVEVLSRFVDRGWSVVTMATPTSRYGHRRDERVADVCGDAVEFVSGDGLVRGADWPREEWQDRVEAWLTDTQQEPRWRERDATRLAIETGVSPAAIDAAFDVTPTKTKVPTGTHRVATTQLREFVDRIHAYPGNISAPQDARGGTSGLSPYLNFGLLSVRQVYQHVNETVPESRGRDMFVSRLFWNLHYNQKLADWPGWATEAVNPVLAGLNEDTHDPALVAAWKDGETGYPMVDASMRCLRDTGWLNFRMRAMCASFFTHVLQQPWWIGADWYHHHLIDSDVGINYTQWQSQAGLVGKPSQRVYNPRKQVRDHDPDGEWITEWVPELADLPSEFLPQPERTPVAVQRECGVRIGETYPLPVVEFESRREAFWNRYERLRPKAARALARPKIARRASFSGGYAAARAIADEYGSEVDDGVQTSLTDIGDNRDAPNPKSGSDADGSSLDTPAAETATRDAGVTPTGVGRRAGEPSPDDRSAAAVENDDEGETNETDTPEARDHDTDAEQNQTRLTQYDDTT
ncbi:MAG: FAD-binding domain-containing protein [Natronomonas sp.]